MFSTLKEAISKLIDTYRGRSVAALPAPVQGDEAVGVVNPLDTSIPYSIRSAAISKEEAAPSRKMVPVMRMMFHPIKVREEYRKDVDLGEKYLKRMFTYGIISAVLFLIIFIFMEDPGGILRRSIGYRSTLTWQGLGVYSSIVALVFFLVTLLLRYLALLNIAYLNTAKYTISSDVSTVGHPPVSIIVPAYNEGKLLRSTIQSLLQLDYPTFEIIIVDDGSKDDTRQVAQSLVGDYGHARIKLVEKKNGGKSTALNAGIQVSE